MDSEQPKPKKRTIRIPSLFLTDVLLKKIQHERLTGYALAKLCKGRLKERNIYQWLKDPRRHTLDMRSVDVLMDALGITLHGGPSRFRVIAKAWTDWQEPRLTPPLPKEGEPNKLGITSKIRHFE